MNSPSTVCLALYNPPEAALALVCWDSVRFFVAMVIFGSKFFALKNEGPRAFAYFLRVQFV